MAARRSKRFFGEMQKDALLKSIGDCRLRCTDSLGKAPINGDIYKAILPITAAIDSLAELLTGDRTHFHEKMHSTPGHGRASSADMYPVEKF